MTRIAPGNRFTCLLLVAVVGLFKCPAQVAPPPAAVPAGAATPVSLSATATPYRAAWQQRFTLGPGDSLNLSLFEVPNTTYPEVVIGPDGRISFLQARDVVAAGLTIDELRAKLDETLSKYYQTPRTVITPAAFRSKRYFVLGAVVNRGVYAFDRPMTVIEALARAGGLETGMYGARTVEVADLAHSFLVRNNQRMPVDFERLFQQGDLSQNIPLEPGDYLYFASSDANQIYVLGEVGAPGVALFAPRTTAVTAITTSGGFTERAFKSRVLVVRGSLNHPQTFVVNTSDILAGKERDFPLQAKDIVYVSANPWVKAVDLLDMATRAFLQGMTVEWTTLNIGPIITSPLLPSIK
jgi:protein involved in polysaccharide export with SLBB domain